MCSSHATVRGLLHELNGETLVLVDAEASPEHLSRGTVEGVDVQLVVAEPYFKSLETARRYSQLGKDLGISTVMIVANKIRDPEDQEAISEFCRSNSMEIAGFIPFDPSLAAAERAGIAPMDHEPDAPSVRAIGEVLERIHHPVGVKPDG